MEYGSTLYGTRLPTSDTDYKAIHLPRGWDILTQRTQGVMDSGTKDKSLRNVKNTAEDTDDESFALHKSFAMLAMGDMMAVEMLFAPPENLVATSPDWEHLVAHRNQLINRQCAGFTGFMRTQAGKYAVKGERVAAARAASELFTSLCEVYGEHVRIKDLYEDGKAGTAGIDAFIDVHAPFAQKVNLPHRHTGKDGWHIEVCDRKVPYGEKLRTARDLFTKVLAEYGSRALAAESGQGADWKSLSHAVRVGHQSMELLTPGRITFPRPQAEFLKSIRRGECPIKEVTEHLYALLDMIDAASKTCTFFPEKPDQGIYDALIVHYYRGQVT